MSRKSPSLLKILNDTLDLMTLMTLFIYPVFPDFVDTFPEKASDCRILFFHKMFVWD